METQESMNMTRAVMRCLKEKYATFRGRASRSEYWWFTLAVMLVSIALSMMEVAFMSGETFDSIPEGNGPLTMLFSLAVLLPELAVSVRRLHDTGHSGWWLLLAFVPLIGSLVLLWWSVSPSEQGENRFGPQPPETLA